MIGFLIIVVFLPFLIGAWLGFRAHIWARFYGAALMVVGYWVFLFYLPIFIDKVFGVPTPEPFLLVKVLSLVMTFGMSPLWLPVGAVGFGVGYLYRGEENRRSKFNNEAASDSELLG